MRTLLFTFAFLFCVPSYAQQQNKIDSVQALLARDISDPNKLKTQLTLSQLLENQDREKSRNLALEVLNSKSKSLSDSIKSAAYLRLATVAYKQKKDSLALTYLNEIEAIYDLNDSIIPPLIFSKSYRSEISKFTFSMEGVLAAKKYILEGQELAKKSENEFLINFMTYRLGEWHGFFSEAEAPEKHLDTARIYFEKVLPYYKRIGNLEYESKIYYSLASVAVYNKDFKTAEKYYNERLKAINKTGDSIEIANAYTGLGGYYLRTKQPEKAIVLYDSALTIFSSKGYSDLGKKGELMHKYALVHEQQGDYKAAMNSLFSELVLRDSLFLEENNKGAIEMASKYETEKKQQEIALLKTENALAVQQKKNQRNIMLGGIALTTAAGIFLFLGFRNRKKTNNKLRDLDTAKSNFFANISHEFRTPLSLIAGPIEEQLQKPDLPAREKQNLQTAQRNSQRLVTLVDQLLDLSKLESGHFNLKIQHGDLSTFLKSLASSFEFIAQEKKQNYSAQIDIPESNYWFDADALEKITTNLLSNAIKYSPESATIELNAIVNNGKLNLKVRNSGTRVSKDVLATIFNRFQRADEETAGSGIGLALTKELVELHKGTIRVKNENGWMIFDVILPVHSAAFTEENRYEGIIEAPERKDQMNTTGTTEPTPILEEKDIFSKDINPILLIVDDNEDLRNYVSSLFQEDYTVHTAHNGKAGFTIAQEVVPDLIITDLMMPQEDGLVFTKNCKSSDTTSHIPVLMLTAKAGDENQLEGLETGADAYITKPFNTEILKSTVNNLLESRRKLQERFSQEIILLPKDIATNSIEEKFLENLQAVMDDKLIESDFSTEDFAQSLGMSRMQLHRKLKALTGLSATEFIRSQRLKLAAQLLKKSDINVSQVGYSVGFNNHSYFTKCFKEQYGLAPSEYAKTK